MLPPLGLGIDKTVSFGGGTTPLENALRFDGVDEFMKTAKANIDTSIVSGVNPQFTLHVLFRHVGAITNNASGFTLYDDAADSCFISYFERGTDGIQYFFYHAGGTHSLTSNNNIVVANQWSCASLVIDGASSKVLHNGTDQTSSTNINNSTTYGKGNLGTSWVLNGYNDGATATNFNGDVAQVLLINEPIDLATHQELYNGGSFLKHSGIIASNKVIPVLEDNYFWNGSEFDGNSSMQTTNMEEAAKITI